MRTMASHDRCTGPTGSAREAKRNGMNAGTQHPQRPKRGGCPRSLSRLGPALPELKECASQRQVLVKSRHGPLFQVGPEPPPMPPRAASVPPPHAGATAVGTHPTASSESPAGTHPNAARSASCRAPECRFHAALSHCLVPDRRFRSLFRQHRIEHSLFDRAELCDRAERPQGQGDALPVGGDGHPDPFARLCAPEWFPFVPASVLLWQAGLHAPACVRKQGTPRFCGMADFTCGSRSCGVSVCNMLRLSRMEWNRGGSGAGRFWALTAGAVGF